ncbi:hypothetical protein QD001_001362 [Stenotrophomonas maltophilia]|nr:hypothetical protein [Stenotrophomonas maltophilia]
MSNDKSQYNGQNGNGYQPLPCAPTPPPGPEVGSPTLAGAQPGGRVRLGDGPTIEKRARELLAKEWEKLSFDAPVEELRAGCELPPVVAAGVRAIVAALSANPFPDGQRNDSDLLAGLRDVEEHLYYAGSNPIHAATVRAAINTLTAQPSRGGQGDALLDQARKLFDELGAIADDDRCVEILAAALPARQPVGELLWCLHVLGMDDVHPAPSKAHAEKAAAWHNEQFKDQAARLGISIEAKVVPWPHSAESHADGVAEFIPQWLIPQWQLDALEANAKQPAQAVDLGRIRATVQALLNWIDDWAETPEESGIDAIEVEAAAVLDLIDSQAVGNG